MKERQSKAVNECIITIRLFDNPLELMVIQVYAPTTDAEEEHIDGFYDHVQFEFDKTCKKNVLLVVVDWNAKIGNINEENIDVLFDLGKERGE